MASTGELELLRRCGISGDRIIQTHPVKSRRTIDAALTAGVRTFVVDTASEAAKFRPQDGARLLVRLAFSHPDAVSDLSTKFGRPPSEAAELVRRVVGTGLEVAGLSFHVGSQLNDVTAWQHAVRVGLAIIDDLARVGITLHVLDLGGGFPVPYTGPVFGAHDLAAALDPCWPGGGCWCSPNRGGPWSRRP